jgi:hypothetical protein
MTDLVPSVPSKVKKSSTVLNASVGSPFLALLNRASHLTAALSAFARSVCFALLRRIAARPAVDFLKLLDAAIFNVIAGNADAHGKNFSILYDDDGPPLAPLYDQLAAAAYPDLSENFAMQIGKRAKLSELDDTGWTTFAADAGLGSPLVRRRVAEISERAILQTNVAAADLVRPGRDDKALLQFAEMVVDRAQRFARSTKGNGPPTSRSTIPLSNAGDERDRAVPKSAAGHGPGAISRTVPATRRSGFRRRQSSTDLPSPPRESGLP